MGEPPVPLEELRTLLRLTQGFPASLQILKVLARTPLETVIEMYRDSPADLVAILGPWVRVVNPEQIVAHQRRMRLFPKSRDKSFEQSPLELAFRISPLTEFLDQLFSDPRAARLCASIAATILVGLVDEEMREYFQSHPQRVLHVAQAYSQELAELRAASEQGPQWCPEYDSGIACLADLDPAEFASLNGFAFSSGDAITSNGEHGEGEGED